MTDERERRLDDLLEATSENTKSKAIDQATKYYVRMAGGTGAVPTGAVEELMELAIDEGSLTPAQIATVLNVVELPFALADQLADLCLFNTGLPWSTSGVSTIWTVELVLRNRTASDEKGIQSALTERSSGRVQQQVTGLAARFSTG